MEKITFFDCDSLTATVFVLVEAKNEAGQLCNMLCKEEKQRSVVCLIVFWKSTKKREQNVFIAMTHFLKRPNVYDMTERFGLARPPVSHHASKCFRRFPT